MPIAKNSATYYFAARLASVLLADVEGEAIEQAADQIGRAGGTAIAAACDVTDEEQVAVTS